MKHDELPWTRHLKTPASCELDSRMWTAGKSQVLKGGVSVLNGHDIQGSLQLRRGMDGVECPGTIGGGSWSHRCELQWKKPSSYIDCMIAIVIEKAVTKPCLVLILPKIW